MPLIAVGILAGLVLGLGLLFANRPKAAWVVGLATPLLAWALSGPGSWLAFAAVAALFGVALAAFAVPAWRRRWLTARLLPAVSRLLPRLGDTERTALEAGSVWWDGELFSGVPDWRRLQAFEPKPLSAEEQAFLDGPVDALCRRLDDWQIAQQGDLPEEVWQTLRSERFFGIIIPKRYGGLGFSAQAHSAIVTKLSSRSVTAAVTVMVPNSLGPAELLLHYGTPEQCDRYLPKLATGEEVPCFALTGPEAGSDAAATDSEGIVCRGKWQGEEVLGLRLHWRKRYITLAPIATLIGLAFRLRDPDHLLGEREDLGITCALVPAQLPGIQIGERHDAMGVPFQNGPTEADDVFVPLDAIIGGRAGAGQGWKMLMETLSAGRSISLPSVAVAGCQVSARAASAYAMVREQFDTPIGRFEGVEEPLARIAGLTYTTDAARRVTAAAVDAGEKPAVLSAIVKAWTTEAMRNVVNDAMDIRAGAAIMRGPRNILARSYAAIPIGITVEGANILTRSMIVYGQGAIRCHPYALEEIHAAAEGDLARFDRALFGHLGFTTGSAVRSLLLGLSGGRLARHVPHLPERRALQRLSRLSAAFALVSDAAMMTLGGELKRREKITGRLADALAWLYLASTAFKRFQLEGAPDADRAFLLWSVDHAGAEVERALDGVLRNLPARAVAWALRPLVFPLGRRERGPNDARGAAVVRALLDDPDARERLTGAIYRPPPDEPGLGRLEAALGHAGAALAVEAKIRQAIRDGRLEKVAPGDALARAARDAGVIDDAELDRLGAAAEAREEAIQVDAFAPEAFAAQRR